MKSGRGIPSSPRAVLVFFSLFSTLGCGNIWFKGPPQAPRTPSVLGGGIISGNANQLISQGKEAPIQLKVAQAFFVGESLHVKVRLSTRASLPTEKLVVGVLGLKEGRIVETHYARLKELTGEALLKAGESTLVPFRLTSHDLSEYQVSGSWGEEAVELWEAKKDTAQAPESAENEDDIQPVTEVPTKTIPEKIEERNPPAPTEEEIPVIRPGVLGSAKDAELEGVELQEQPAEDCTAPPCDIRYTILARVVNRTRGPMGKIKLAVGISWSENKSLPRSPAHGAALRPGEEVVDLSSTVLQSGQSKKLRVKVARAVPVIPGGAFLPYIRVVSSEILDFSAPKK